VITTGAALSGKVLPFAQSNLRAIDAGELYNPLSKESQLLFNWQEEIWNI
jgi:hypothetical protein